MPGVVRLADDVCERSESVEDLHSLAVGDRPVEPAEVTQKTCLEDDGAAGVAVEEAAASVRVVLDQILD
jgi:hypothetical protein